MMYPLTKKSKKFFFQNFLRYFLFGGDNYPGNDRCYTDDKEKCPDNVRFKGEAKIPAKILVWIAISERGISKPLFRKSNVDNRWTNLFRAMP
jgi:hypothetical protein